MCLYIKSEKKPKWKKAKKDIIVWKCIDRFSADPTIGLPDLRGKYNSKLRYKIGKKAPRLWFIRFEKDGHHEWKVERAYHSYDPVTSYPNWTNAIFVIPKGAKYFYSNIEQDIVSNQIKFIGWKKDV